MVAFLLASSRSPPHKIISHTPAHPNKLPKNQVFAHFEGSKSTPNDSSTVTGSPIEWAGKLRKMRKKAARCASNPSRTTGSLPNLLVYVLKIPNTRPPPGTECNSTVSTFYAEFLYETNRCMLLGLSPPPPPPPTPPKNKVLYETLYDMLCDHSLNQNKRGSQ